MKMAFYHSREKKIFIASTDKEIYINHLFENDDQAYAFCCSIKYIYRGDDAYEYYEKPTLDFEYDIDINGLSFSIISHETPLNDDDIEEVILALIDVCTPDGPKPVHRPRRPRPESEPESGPRP